MKSKDKYKIVCMALKKHWYDFFDVYCFTPKNYPKEIEKVMGITKEQWEAQLKKSEKELNEIARVFIHYAKLGDLNYQVMLSIMNREQFKTYRGAE